MLWLNLIDVNHVACVTQAFSSYQITRVNACKQRIIGGKPSSGVHPVDGVPIISEVAEMTLTNIVVAALFFKPHVG